LTTEQKTELVSDKTDLEEQNTELASDKNDLIQKLDKANKDLSDSQSTLADMTALNNACNTAKDTCDTNLENTQEELTDMTASKTHYKNLFREVQSLENTFRHSDMALGRYGNPEQEAVGSSMVECGSTPLLSSIHTLLLGIGIGAVSVGIMNKAFSQKLGDEYKAMLEI